MEIRIPDDSVKIFVNGVEYSPTPTPASSDIEEREGRDWEIQSFKINDQIWKLNELGNYQCRTGLQYPLHIMLNDGNPIHSVLRKKDSVLFTVGDKFFNNAAGYYTEHAIDRFEINGKVMKVLYAKREPSYYEITDIQPLPQRTKPERNGSFSREMEMLEERIAYIEKKLNIEG